MLLALLASLQIAWSGIGAPAHGATSVPVLIARPLQGRTPLVYQNPVTVRALEGRTPVPAEWTVTPSGAVDFDSGTSEIGDWPQAWVEIGQYRGPVTIKAAYNGLTGSTPGFVYNALSASCYMGYPNGVKFNDNGEAKPAGTPHESDIFTIGPRNESHMSQFYGCTGAFVNSSPHFVVHLPYGGAIIHRSSGIYFGDVRVSAWHNEYTTLPDLAPGDIVVFRLHDGRVAKLLYDPPEPGTFGGIYLAGPPRGDFYDYVYYHHVKPQPHAIFGRH